MFKVTICEKNNSMATVHINHRPNGFEVYIKEIPSIIEGLKSMSTYSSPDSISSFCPLYGNNFYFMHQDKEEIIQSLQHFYEEKYKYILNKEINPY